MSAVARLNEWEHPKPIWILLLILSFWVSWPVGVVLLAYLMWSGRLEAWKRAGLNLWNEGIGPMRPDIGWPRRSSGNRVSQSDLRDFAGGQTRRCANKSSGTSSPESTAACKVASENQVRDVAARGSRYATVSSNCSIGSLHALNTIR